ncbi:hypothetical protein LVY75_07480 (plasmid) [Sinorhizobium sp. B11]
MARIGKIAPRFFYSPFFSPSVAGLSALPHRRSDLPPSPAASDRLAEVVQMDGFEIGSWNRN